MNLAVQELDRNYFYYAMIVAALGFQFLLFVATLMVHWEGLKLI